MNEKIPLSLVVYPDPLLKKRLQEVHTFDELLAWRLQEMFRLMYASKGIGLAGNQAGLDQRIIVMNLSGDPENKEEEMVFINPEIKSQSKATIIEEEGCLSFPELKIDIPRHETVTFSAMDETGQRLVYEASDLFARCLQHELDHINGITFVERLTPSERALITDRLKELESAYQARSN